MDTEQSKEKRRVLVAGATGFVGSALIPRLVAAGYRVRAATRDASKAPQVRGVEWVDCDVNAPDDLRRALSGVDVALYLVHAIGTSANYAETEQRAAIEFRSAARQANVQRIVYLGGVAPKGEASEHLQSRLRVGELLREGSVPTLELRASMIIGAGSVSWQIVRDLALRLPAMVLPAWTDSKTSPVDIRDVTEALLRGIEVPLESSAWYDLPGPEVLSARDILLRVAALRGRKIPHVRVPLLSVSLSSWWLKLITRADFAVARELVLGLSNDLIAESDEYWTKIDYRPLFGFDDAARHALADERAPKDDAWQMGARWEESMVQLLGEKTSR